MDAASAWAIRTMTDDRTGAIATGTAPGRPVTSAERRDRLIARLLSSQPSGGAPWRASEVELFRAPGRINLIGEHTDYNEGWVMPAAIDLDAWLAVRPWDRPAIELTALQLDETRSIGFDELEPVAPGAAVWLDYIAGTVWALLEAGLPVRGFAGVLDSTVPPAAGLSSSAALEMATGWAALAAGAARPTAARLALLGQRAENAYVGVNCGIMDQYASSAGKSGNAVLLDCRSLEARYVPLPADLSLVICDTASPRRLSTSAYNERREECETGARLIAEREPGVRALRDVDPEMLARHVDRLPDAIARRCRHVVEENARTLAAADAFAAGDLDALGRLFADSHASLRDLFEVSSAELDAMVEIAIRVPGVVAARMTGGGFGGCTVNLVRPGSEDALRQGILREYPIRTGLQPRVYVVSAADGAGPVG